MKNQKSLMSSAFSLLIVCCMVFQTMGISLTAFAAKNNVTGDVIGELDYTIDNPYKDVDWDTWYQYKGATHVHTHVSDGDEDVNEMIEKYYELGYHLMSLTDHGTVNYGWTASRSRHTMFSYQALVHGGIDPLKKEREVQINAGYGREDGIGMIDVPLGIELNGAAIKKVHINSFFVDAGDGDMELDADWPSDAIAKSQRAVAPDGGKGVCHINHVGEWSGGNDDVGVYDDDFVKRFAQIFRDYDVCVGMELVNTSDGRTRNDRYLYDKVLMELAPEGRNVFGFCEDDSHEFSDCGRNINYYIMPEQTWQAVRTSMTTGAFFASSKHAKTPDELGSGFTGTGDFPRISRIEIDEEKDHIVLHTSKANKLKMVADGVIIESINVNEDGEIITLDLNAYEDEIGSYVRVFLTGPGGITYVQPFLLTSESKISSTLNFEIPYEGFELVLKDEQGNVVDPINSEYYFKVDAGTYYYSVTKFGYIPIVDEPLTVTQEQLDAGEDITVTVTLEGDNAVSFVYFYVPEAIYLNPYDNQTFGHYVDRENEPNGRLNSIGLKTTGNVYFYCKDASDITITAQMEYGGKLDGLCFGTDKKTFSVSSDTDTVSTAITYGAFSEAYSGDSLIKWTVTYNLAGATLEAYAYSYVYALPTGLGSVAAAGGYAETSKNIFGWAHSTMCITGTVWLAGVHSVSGGSYAYKFPYYGTAESIKADGTGNLTQTGIGMGTASDDSSGGSVTVNPVGGTGHITIDTSRTTNYNQIPYLSAGLDVNYADETDGDDCDDLSNYLNFGDISLYSENIDDIRPYAGQRMYASDNSSEGRGINKAVDINEENIAIVGNISGGKSDRNDTIHGTVYLEPVYVNKSQLRSLVNDEIMSAKQSGTMTDQKAFESYLELMKYAYTVLGDPTSTQADVDLAFKNLTETAGSLEPAKSTLTINYVFDSGSVFKTEDVDYTLGSTVSLEFTDFGGCTFDGWTVYSNDVSFINGTDDTIRFYAKASDMSVDVFYTAHRFEVVYDTLGGDFSLSGGDGYTATYGSDYTLPESVPTKDGFVFERWLLDLNSEFYEKGATLRYDFESNAVFTAQYTPLKYNVSFDLSGGDEFEPIGISGYSIDFEDSYALPINLPVRTGYNFAGWLLDVSGEVYPAGQTVTWLFPGDGQFIAQWLPIKYTVHFAGGDGATGSLDSVVAEYDEILTLPEYGAFEKLGYEQTAWKTDEGIEYLAGDEISNLVSEEGGSITFTAVYTAETYTLIYVGVNEAEFSAEAPKTHTYGSKTVIPDVTRDGFTFIGWEMNGENLGTELILSAYDYADDIVLTALWSRDSCSVKISTTLGGFIKLYVDGKFISPENGVITLNSGTKVVLKPVSVCGFELSEITATVNGKTTILDGDYSYTLDGDVSFKATYVESKASNLITVTGGMISARRKLLVPMYGVVSAVASAPEDGMKFSHWAVGSSDGKPVSYDSVYTFISVSDLNLVAVYVPESTVIEKAAAISTYVSSDTHITKVNGHNSLSYYGTITLPNEYEIVETGLLLTNLDEGLITDDSFIIGAESVVKLQSTVVSEYGQVKVSVNNVSDNQTRSGRFYLTYTDGVDTYTVYSDNWSTLITEV